MDYFLYIGIKVALMQINWMKAGRGFIYIRMVDSLFIGSGGEENEEQED